VRYPERKSSPSSTDARRLVGDESVQVVQQVVDVVVHGDEQAANNLTSNTNQLTIDSTASMKVVIEVKVVMNSQTKQDKTGQFSSLHERGRDKDGAEAWGKQMVRSARGPFPAILCLIPSVSITPHRVTE
jgi:hypothetical protein